MASGNTSISNDEITETTTTDLISMTTSVAGMLVDDARLVRLLLTALDLKSIESNIAWLLNLQRETEREN